MSAPSDSSRAVLAARLRLALRRATGALVDVDAALAEPASAAAQIIAWRALGAQELDHLLDMYENKASVAAAARASVPSAAATRPAAAQVVDLKPKPDGALTKRYIRGAR